MHTNKPSGSVTALYIGTGKVAPLNRGWWIVKPQEQATNGSPYGEKSVE
ncbi:hypothetical prophage protein [Citrobacter rodentium ICC168]|uniref:Hypothetical prophage protein n=1 Tax=Citrobacter rodentium (strain ICC168) TaxID=637910 RepID=D2TUU8_CITRI|nr:hypothetical prophage protein [Citrobacter rodentium ICC168]